MSFEGRTPDDELEAVRRELAGLGQEPLPPAVATRLDARLDAELSATPLSARRVRRHRLRIGASLSAAVAVAAGIVFALGTGGGGQPAPEASALHSTAKSAAADSTGTTKVAVNKVVAGAASAAPAGKRCAPASQTGGDRPRAACPGARGGHARAV
ncbi:MAG TPA: hypothetical protein VFD90_16685 [Gaiellales bacterium]|nr:hypothetical protein [Gaiellales bacterium]